MKKFIFMTALAATMGLMTSCSEDELTSPTSVDSNTIAFATKSGKAMTRSASTLTELEKFTVSANNADNSIFFADQLFTYDMGASIFMSATPYYWPLGGSLSFFAINEPGTKSLDGNNVPSYTYENWSGESDLVAATVLAGTKTMPYPLTFRHLTSQISVRAEAADKTEELTYELVNVTMTAPCDGTYHFATATGGTGTWEIDATKKKAYDYGDAFPKSFIQSASVSSGDTYWNILPSDDSSITFKVEYIVYQNGHPIADFTGSNAKSCTADNVKLLAGKRYIYNFILSRTTEDVITFSMTMADWQDGVTSNADVDFLVAAEAEPEKTWVRYADGSYSSFTASSTFSASSVTNLTEVTDILLGSGVKKIAAKTFYNCDKL